MKQVNMRLNELHRFVNGGISYRSWMENKFTQYPELMKFPMENVPHYIAKGVGQSKLESINEQEIKSTHFALDRFGFILPVEIRTFGAGGYWGDPYETKGALWFNLGYEKENKLYLNASYNAAGVVIYHGVSFTLEQAENTIVSYVRNLCNGLEKGMKI